MLQFISQVNARTWETQTADAIKKFLDDKQIPLLVENGGTCPVPSQELQDD
jgi:hypothetical protein